MNKISFVLVLLLAVSCNNSTKSEKSDILYPGESSVDISQINMNISGNGDNACVEGFDCEENENRFGVCNMVKDSKSLVLLQKVSIGEDFSSECDGPYFAPGIKAEFRVVALLGGESVENTQNIFIPYSERCYSSVYENDIFVMGINKVNNQMVTTSCVEATINSDANIDSVSEDSNIPSTFEELVMEVSNAYIENKDLCGNLSHRDEQDFIEFYTTPYYCEEAPDNNRP